MLSWEIEALAPFVPGSVIVRSIGMSDAIEREEDRRRGHTAIAIGDDLLITSDAGGQLVSLRSSSSDFQVPSSSKNSLAERFMADGMCPPRAPRKTSPEN